MKKQVIALALLGLMLTASPAFAKNSGEDQGGGFHWGNLFHFGKKHSDQFMVAGTIKSIGSGTVVITSTSSFNVPNVVNGDVTVKTDANTIVSSSSDKTKKIEKGENENNNNDTSATSTTTTTAVPVFTLSS